MPAVPPRPNDPNATLWLIKYPDGRYYWEPTPGVTYSGPDRWCVSEMAAKKYPTKEAAQHRADQLGAGCRVVQYCRH